MPCQMMAQYLVQLIQTTNTNPEFLQQIFVCLLFEYFDKLKVLNYNQNTPKKDKRTGYTENIESTLQHLKY